jgi:hypothetical protein
MWIVFLREQKVAVLTVLYMLYRVQVILQISPLPQCEPLFSVPQVQIQVEFYIYITNMSFPFPESPDYPHIILPLLSTPLHFSSHLTSQDLPHGKPHNTISQFPPIPSARPSSPFCVPTTPCSGRLHILDSDPMLHASELKFSSPVTSCCTTSACTYVVFPSTTYAYAPTSGLLCCGCLGEFQEVGNCFPSSETIVFKVKV